MQRATTDLSDVQREPLVTFPPDEMAALVRSFTPARLAALLDVTDLKADTQEPKMRKMAEWAVTLGCASVCVNPVEGSDVLPELLRGTPVKECYVIDFPLGKLDPDMKALQTAHTVKKSRAIRGEGPGHIELDMVVNVGRFKRDPGYTAAEVDAVVSAADGEAVKVIIRSSELTPAELYRMSAIIGASGAAFIKNSTGMDAFGAFPEHIRVMREVVGPDMGVKAAGGISEAMTAMRLIYAGARDPRLQGPDRFRIGTSAPLTILSSFGWLGHHTEDWLATGVTPCTICPHFHTAKQRRETREAYIERCRGCRHRDYLTHKDM